MYAQSEYRTVRFATREVKVGAIGIGGANPIRIQSMTNTPTLDVDATVEQIIRLEEVGCEIVRLTAQNLVAAQALKEIKNRLTKRGSIVPLVADIHFLPQAAMEAIEHVDKVRINPGNYSDKRQNLSQTLSDSEYEKELQKIYESFSPLVKRAKELGKALRIGVNHGSLSDRIINRYGDSPRGMVESALEFVKIAESHGFNQMVLSLKASNTRVMIQSYRLMVERMIKEKMNYPLHVGVTETGAGEDGEIKSAIGIGTLLIDGIGDTIRVSLTGDPVWEIPVARKLINCVQYADLEQQNETEFLESKEVRDYSRREIDTITLTLPISHNFPPRVVSPLLSLNELTKKNEYPLEYVLIDINDLEKSKSFYDQKLASLFIIEVKQYSDLKLLKLIEAWNLRQMSIGICIAFNPQEAIFEEICKFVKEHNQVLISDAVWLNEEITSWPEISTIFTLSKPYKGMHATSSYRYLAEKVKNLRTPIWIRNTLANTKNAENFEQYLLNSSAFSGSLLCDGVGDLISMEGPFLPQGRALSLAYDILQGTRLRFSKTEFIVCPSCGRTLYDIDSTAKKIKEQLGHLPNVTIAVMGCIVNGPGEMADADFGYVGAGVGKVNLYVKKTCVETGIPESEAVEKLILLIKSHGKWIDA